MYLRRLLCSDHIGGPHGSVGGRVGHERHGDRSMQLPAFLHVYLNSHPAMHHDNGEAQHYCKSITLTK